jgi:hypothetical protein
MRTFEIAPAKLAGFVTKGLKPEKVIEINTLQTKMDASIDKKSAEFNAMNLRIGQIINAFVLRACMIGIIKLTKRVHKAVSSMPTAGKTYDQLEKIMIGQLESLRSARKATPVIEDVFEVEV